MVASLWDDAEAAGHAGDLGQRIYTSRLLGRDPDLVLHGGGNTSMKITRRNVFGETVEVLVVKGSGGDLATIDESGFAHLKLDHVARLADLDVLSDTEMARQLTLAATAAGPPPSVEAILHAVLPHRFVDHTHADAVVTLTNTPAGAELIDEVYGDRVVVVDYVMPGFDLARTCAARVAETKRPGVEAMILMNHGIFTFADTARDSYEAMIRLVRMAEGRLDRSVPTWSNRSPSAPGIDRPSRARLLARLRADVSAAAGGPMVMSSHSDAPVAAFLDREDLADVSQRGPATPDHVIRTKPVPMLGRDVAAYAAAYLAYVETHRDRAPAEIQVLDPAPRVVLDAELGMCCVGRTPADAAIAEDIYRHTMDVINRAEALGGYRPISTADQFDMEYWELEQAKLHRRGVAGPLAGEVAFVTGAGRGIGRACAEALMDQGAAVVGVDVDPAVTEQRQGRQWLGVVADVTDPGALAPAVAAAVERFGGIDMVVANAGVFPPGTPIAQLDEARWRQVMTVNLDANLSLLRLVHPFLCLAPRGGRVVVIGSKNVAAPGPGAAAYSASKAALTQLARVGALEWGGDGIRVNVIHPNAVFDTGIWTEDVLAQRAASYAMTVERYRTDNVLGIEVTSTAVAAMCVAMCSATFACTTGAQVGVDGGNSRII